MLSHDHAGQGILEVEIHAFGRFPGFVYADLYKLTFVSACIKIDKVQSQIQLQCESRYLTLPLEEIQVMARTKIRFPWLYPVELWENVMPPNEPSKTFPTNRNKPQHLTF